MPRRQYLDLLRWVCRAEAVSRNLPFVAINLPQHEKLLVRFALLTALVHQYHCAVARRSCECPVRSSDDDFFDIKLHVEFQHREEAFICVRQCSGPDIGLLVLWHADAVVAVEGHAVRGGRRVEAIAVRQQQGRNSLLIGHYRILYQTGWLWVKVMNTYWLPLSWMLCVNDGRIQKLPDLISDKVVTGCLALDIYIPRTPTWPEIE